MNNTVCEFDNIVHFQLAPKCEDTLIRCQWGDSEVNCSEVFSLRKTWEGFCCIFNYVRPFGILTTEE